MHRESPRASDLEDVGALQPQPPPTQGVVEQVELAVVDDNKSDNQHRAKVSMTLANITFFGNFFGLAGAAPFYGLLMKDLGFSASGVGLLSAINPFSTLTIVPLLAYIADRYHCNRIMVVIGIVVSASALIFATSDVSNAPSGTLLLQGTAMVIHFSTMAHVEPFLDNHVMSLLPPHQRDEWGASRSYGAYGWGIGALLSAQMMGLVGWPWAAGQHVVGRAITIFGFFATTPYAAKETTTMRYLEVWRFVLSHKRLALYLACVCCMGMGYVLVGTFLFIFLRELGAPEVLFGLSITMTVVVEIPLFRNATWLHSKFSNRQLFTAAACSWVVRVLGYSLLQNPWMVLFLEPLHGGCFGLMWLAGVNTVNAAFPPSLAASAFGFLHAAAFGIGPMVGNIIGGHLYDGLGARMMFRCAAAFMGTMIVCYVILDRIFEAAEKEHSGVEGGITPHATPNNDNNDDVRTSAEMNTVAEV